MVWRNVFAQKDTLVSVDIGASSIKFVEIELGGGSPRLKSLGLAPLKSEGSGVFSGNTIAQTASVAEQVDELLSSHGITDAQVALAMPAPSVFTKKIRTARMSADELATNIQFEAGNFIPHNIDAVKLDYHVLGTVGKDQLEVLVVAVKNEVVESYLDCFAAIGRTVSVVDVDYFAVQNIFETAHPDLHAKTVALINIGHRFSAINIVHGGQTLFTGDISIGGRSFTEAIADATGSSSTEAETLKRQAGEGNPLAQEAIVKQVEQVAGEFNRQLSFFWSASGAEQGIDRIMLTGGGALVPGLVASLREKTGIESELLLPFTGMERGDDVASDLLKDNQPLFSVAAGLALRRPGDRDELDLEEEAA